MVALTLHAPESESVVTRADTRTPWSKRCGRSLARAFRKPMLYPLSYEGRH